jgi:hypothetical protein
MRSIWKVAVPVSWEGYAVTVAWFLGMSLLQLEGDLARRSIAITLLVAAYGVIIFLTWADPEGEDRSWREMLWSRQTVVTLVVLVLFAAVFIGAVYLACRVGGCHRPTSWYHGPTLFR